MTYYTSYQSPIGRLLLIGDETALTGVHFVEQGQPQGVQTDWVEDAAKFSKTRAQLDAYFAGTLSEFSLALRFEGTPFQKQVWHQLCTMPYGTLTTYKDLAQKIGRPKAMRAVGTALGKNPLCIIGPCHRVIASDGTLGGYAGGLAAKQFLLKLERAPM